MTARKKLGLPNGPTERQIQTAIIEFISVVAGYRVIHFPAGGIDPQWRGMMARNGTPAGVPDLLIFRPASRIEFSFPIEPVHGVAVGFMEVKRPGGRLSDAQQRWSDWCATHDAPWALVTSVDDADAALKEWGWR